MTPPNGTNVVNPVFGYDQAVVLRTDQIRRDGIVSVELVAQMLLQGILFDGNYYIVTSKADAIAKLQALNSGK
jgi:hypothetical protein